MFHHGELYARLEAEVLAEVPLDPAVSALADEGRPLLMRESDSPSKLAFMQMADKVSDLLDAKK